MNSRLVSHSRFWLALSVWLLGSAVSLWLLRGDLGQLFTAWGQAFRHLREPALGVTLLLLGTGMLLSWSGGRVLALFLEEAPALLQRSAFILGKAMVFLPVNALLWSFLGMWIGEFGLPVWSLMPPVVTWASDGWLDRMAQQIWTWAPAVALLSVPMTGQWLALLLREPLPAPNASVEAEETERSLATPHLDSPGRDQGRVLGPSRIRWHATQPLPEPGRGAAKVSLPAVIVCLKRRGLWGGGLLALLLLTVIEDALALPGLGAEVAQGLRGGHAASAASALITLTAVAALWTLLVGGPEHWPLPTARQLSAAGLKTVAWMILVLTLLSSLQGHSLFLARAIGADLALASPATALWTGVPPMLCALSLWLTGHMIAPRSDS
jgi:hypothetical protein